MDYTLVPLFLCLIVVVLLVLWLKLLKRQRRINAERKMDKRVSNQLEFERRMNEERRRGKGDGTPKA